MALSSAVGRNLSSAFQHAGAPGWGVLAVAAGAFVHLTLGTLYTIGNMNPYYISYLCRARSDCEFPSPGHESASYLELQSYMPWLHATAGSGQALTMFLGGTLELNFGPR